mmetsp:Transcript_20737/g.18382  ORF Transcript_20737/g.18382 Transcript_20737/m.18382 type:complete len:467 (+) Transcript_20737:167-1567(+)
MSQTMVRFNMVFHPFFMDYLKPGVKEEQFWIMASLYTKDGFEYGLKKSKFNPIQINSTDLFSKDNWIELHIHQADENNPDIMAISPNNAGVLLDLSCPIISFYSLAIRVDENTKAMSLLVTHHCIIDEKSFPNKILTQSLNSFEFLQMVNVHKLVKPEKSTWGIIPKSNESKYRNVQHQLLSAFALNNTTVCEEISRFIKKKGQCISKAMREMGCTTFKDIKEYIELWTWDVFCQEFKTEISDYEQFTKEENERENEYKHKFKIIDEMMDNFYKFIWANFTSPTRMDNFGQKYLESIESGDYLIYLFQGFVNYIAKLYSSIGTIHLLIIQGYLEKSYSKEHDHNIVERKDLCEYSISDDIPSKPEDVENPYIKGLETHLNTVLSSSNVEDWGISLMELPDIIQDLIFNKVWTFHQRIDGIHSDFGRVSYINSNEISDYYWINSDQRLDLLFNIIETIKDSDKRMLN